MDNEIKNTEGTAPTKITKTWFFQRGENPNDIFACGEEEAWGLLYNRTNWMRRDFKILGVSDGTTYVRILKESESQKQELERKVKDLSMEVTRYLKTYDKLKYDDLLEDTDEKVLKLKGILDKLNTDLDQANAQLADIHRNIINKAFTAELEVARGHIEMPTNHDVFTPSGNRDKVFKALQI